jgi:3-hydroxyacyl-CoA dehydrogenase
MAAGDAPLRRTRDLTDKLGTAEEAAPLFAAMRKRIARRARGQTAPWKCIDAVELAVTLPFDEGIAAERALFEDCVGSPEAYALRHVFFAERAATKVSGVTKETPVQAIERAGVIGFGTMGGGIAMCFANAGIPVTVVEQSRELADKGLARVRANYEVSVKRGRLGQDEVERRLALITPALEYDAIADADFVIEAVFEEIELKKDVFRILDDVCKPGAIIATNTSYQDVDAIAAVTGRPEKVLGTHFFSPANVMRLLEIVRGAKTGAETLATTLRLGKTLGKAGVVVGVCHGFVGNRMLSGYMREASFLVEEGALPRDVDQALFDFGMPMGPFAVGDLAGLDIGWAVRKAEAPTRPKDRRYSPLGDRLCEMGRFGQKTNAGWYRYEPGSRTPVPDPDVEKLIVETSAELGITRREIGGQEIIERCIYALVNEGAKILAEGIAARASDIDTVWINGYGFPAWRGGPMFHGDAVGPAKIHDAVERFHAEHGVFWEPAPLLAELAKSGGKFGDNG